jgi:hypothetical protein
VRPVTQAKVGGDALRFVRSLSYTFSFEFARQGFVFAYQDNVRISVTRLYKVSGVGCAEKEKKKGDVIFEQVPLSFFKKFPLPSYFSYQNDGISRQCNLFMTMNISG